ncbi:hypothetical protein M9H77_30086 [Catharanthus roseus]|uniref:Uncharacterized protein n=1 Tax=Catharanthus roseus TaxID=4058 RepID=A0ACB9ZWL6_CATRO|nr:hypothetical protein M9H77_30086 [Catharanthus roseus]
MVEASIKEFHIYLEGLEELSRLPRHIKNHKKLKGNKLRLLEDVELSSTIEGKDPWERYLHYTKKIIKNEEGAEESICNACLIEGVAIFFIYYLDESVTTLHKSHRRNDNVENHLLVGKVLSICN